MGLLASNVTVQTSATITQNRLGNFTGRPQIAYSRNLTSTQMTKCYPGTVIATASIDVTSLTDSFGDALSFTSVEIIQIQNTNDTDSVTLTGDLIGSDTVTIGPGKCLYIDTSRAVDGTHKTLTFTSASGAPVCDVILIGT